MSSIRLDVVKALTSFCEEQRKAAAKGETIRVDLYQFSNSTTRLATDASLDELERFVKHYSTGGCTALYDAVCQGIDELGAALAAMRESDRPEDVLFVIVTDGEENSSRRFRISDVNERIKRQTEVYNWHFVFLANGIDVQEYAEDMGIAQDDAVEFDRESLAEDFEGEMCSKMCCIREERLLRRQQTDNR